MFVTSITCEMFYFDYFAKTLNSQLFIIVLTLKSLNFYLIIVNSIYETFTLVLKFFLKFFFLIIYLF